MRSAILVKRIAADGCITSNTIRPSSAGFPLMVCALFPRSTTSFGLMSLSCLIRYGWHAAISSCVGVLFAGGKCLTVLVIKQSSRRNPISSMRLVRYCPARPINGLPVLSSLTPGACPKKNIFALLGPSPGTPWHAYLKSGHFLQFSTSLEISSSESFIREESYRKIKAYRSNVSSEGISLLLRWMTSPSRTLFAARSL